MQNKITLWPKKILSSMIDQLGSLASYQKTFVVLLFDLCVAVSSFYFALGLRYGEFLPGQLFIPEFFHSYFLIVCIQVVTFYFFGLYRGIWRYSSTPDLVRIIKGVSMAELFSLLGLFFFNRLQFIPRTSFLIDWPLLIIGLGGGRLFYRIMRDGPINPNQENKIKTAIIGTGAEGDQIFREVQKNPELDFHVVAYLDARLQTSNKTLHGLPILGNVKKLPEIVQKFHLQQMILADPNLDKESLTEIIQYCRQQKIILKAIPRLSDILTGKASILQLRDLGPEDLLKRKIVQLDTDSLQGMIQERTILVTGAGGFIGQELCVQLAKFRPSKIVFFELCEYNLYELEMKMRERFPHLNYEVIIGDIREKEKVDWVFERFRPQVVFHAAALKHVPMVEFNITEGVKTNVKGTYIVASAAKKYFAEKFILISSDKAINPTSIMGATKRVAEIVCQFFQQRTSNTEFITVRFGNVFGSTGSVIPLFIRQIEKGGPVTITHPEMQRYFMAPSEATQLVLQAAAIGNAGEILVLDMGSPVKILDLAKQLIALSGLRPGQDIKIEFTDPRPGEKLFEEVLANEEESLPTRHPMVRIAKARENVSSVEQKIVDLFNSIAQNDDQLAKKFIKNLVPEYKNEDFKVKKETPKHLQLVGDLTN